MLQAEFFFTWSHMWSQVAGVAVVPRFHGDGYSYREGISLLLRG